MTGCSRYLTGLIAAVFVLTTVMAIFVVSLAQVITDEEAIRSRVETGVSPDLVPALLTSVIWERARGPEFFSPDLGPAILQSAVKEFLDPAWTRVQLDALVRSVYRFLETGDSDAASVVVDLRPLMVRFSGDAGVRAVMAGVQRLPTCTESQSGFNLTTGYFEPDYCLPADIPVMDVARRIHADVMHTLAESPELVEEVSVIQVPVLDVRSLSSVQLSRLRWLRSLYAFSQEGVWTIWFIPLACLGLMTLSAVRSVGDWGYWWGWSWLMVAIMTFFLAILAPAFVTASILRSITFMSEIMREPLTRSIQQVLDGLSDLWLRRVYVQAGIILVSSLVMIVVHYVARARILRSQ